MTAKKHDSPNKISPTSLDVARKAGVSRAAVSYVLNGTCVEHVSQQTRTRIWQAAEELGYHHSHPAARALRRGQSDEICCVFNAPHTLLGSEVTNSIQQRIFQHGYVPVVYSNPGMPNEKWHVTLKQMFERRPRGLIISQFMGTTDDLALARQMGVENIVLLSPNAVENIPTIVFSSTSPGSLAAGHLLDRGHRHLGIVQPVNPSLAYLFHERLEGMRTVLAGVPGTTLEIFSLDLSLASAHALIDTWQECPQRPTGIYAFDDEHALRLLAALTDRGIQVPGEMAIVGTDDLSTSQFVRPSLTSIGYGDGNTLGQLAVEMLVNQFTDQLSTLAHPLLLSPQLIPRSSS
jgi:DNA-binding LacI/PurR family transcriptional regulator